MLPGRLPHRAPITPAPQLHGFLAYLMRCTVTGEPYTVFGYNGKQVRDNIHRADLVRAFEAFHRAPRAAAVYNIGGGRAQQLLDARSDLDVRADRRPQALRWEHSDEARIGDHRWWISDSPPFQADYPSGDSRTTSRGCCARPTSTTASSGSRRFADPQTWIDRPDPLRLRRDAHPLLVTPERFRTLAYLTLAALTVIVLTGAAVRLTGSGLGCPDWPKCYGKALPAVSTHALIEFGNRTLSGLVGVLTVVAFLAALLRKPTAGI